MGSPFVRRAALRSPLVPGDTRRSVGARGEALAEAHLLGAGYRVLERNFRTGSGEIDLVAERPGFLVFCEVRARVGTPGMKPSEPGGALESIGPAKRRQVRRMAREWLSSGRRTAGARSVDVLRFDAIGVLVAPDGSLLALEHVEDAF